MKSALAEYHNKSAHEQGHFNTPEQLTLPGFEKLRCVFYGPKSKAQLRVLVVLLRRNLMREEVDRIGRVSNGPDLIGELRDLGLEVACERIKTINSDGHVCLPGCYYLAPNDVRRVKAWFREHGYVVR